MDIKECLRDFWLSKGDNAIGLLKMKGQEIQHYVNNGIINNPFKFFKIATVLESNGYKVDNFSGLPKANREAIAAILAGKVTVEDYVREMNISRDSVLRYIKKSPGASANASQLIAAANLKLNVKSVANEEDEVSEVEFNEKPVVNEFGNKKEVVVINHTLVTNLILAISANCVALEEILINYLAESSESDRVYLRDALETKGFSIFTSSNSVFRLSQKLNALCSEKALTSYKK